MTSKTKRKYVFQEHLEAAPVPIGEQTIGRVLQTRGNNLHQVEDADGSVYLASMPPKFRKNIWVRRGTFVLLEPIAEGRKVRAEVAHVLSRQHVAELRAAGGWPRRFEEAAGGRPPAADDADDAADALQALQLEGNPNRPPPPPAESDDSDSDESESDSDWEQSESELDGDSDRSSSDSGT